MKAETSVAALNTPQPYTIHYTLHDTSQGHTHHGVLGAQAHVECTGALLGHTGIWVAHLRTHMTHTNCAVVSCFIHEQAHVLAASQRAHKPLPLRMPLQMLKRTVEAKCEGTPDLIPILDMPAGSLAQQVCGCRHAPRGAHHTCPLPKSPAHSPRHSTAAIRCTMRRLNIAA